MPASARPPRASAAVGGFVAATALPGATQPVGNGVRGVDACAGIAPPGAGAAAPPVIAGGRPAAPGDETVLVARRRRT
ncbi:hypothetical protein ACIQV3_01080 [Streptomyces sp. NPDC099050]|uniref:hypothetical protein n=1 Tax=Streptomyces sp. NPDC099050 TaxID=3366100 RepID=UPI003800AB0A